MALNLHHLSAYQFDLPQELIAQHPIIPRNGSRLMVVDRARETISEIPFYRLGELLESGDQLVFNNTKVIPARLLGKRSTGGNVELLLIKPLEDGLWEALSKPAKKLTVGSKLFFGEDFSAEVVEILSEGMRKVRFLYEGDFEQLLQRFGRLPLPQYIRKGVEESGDRESYQTVYAVTPGSIAAPTAGLHFTPTMLQELSAKEIEQISITLHVGIGTFRPVMSSDIREHPMHVEQVLISQEAASSLSRPQVQKRICVGTTTCRTLEALSNSEGKIPSGEFEVNPFIYPGYQFRYVKQLLTNFHLPSSTLLMLVCAFAGYELTMEAYAKAVKERFRFFSYGDAMLIL